MSLSQSDYDVNQQTICKNEINTIAPQTTPKQPQTTSQHAYYPIVTSIDTQYGYIASSPTTSTQSPTTPTTTSPTQQLSTPLLHRTFSSISDITLDNINQTIWIRARVQTIRKHGRLCFLLLRDRFDTCQAVIMASSTTSTLPSASTNTTINDTTSTINDTDTIINDQNHIPREMVTFISNINIESWVDIYGTITKTNSSIDNCTQKLAELTIHKLYVVSLNQHKYIPYQINDSFQQPDESHNNKIVIDNDEKSDKTKCNNNHQYISLSTRLDHRSFDLTIPTNQAIFIIQSYVQHFFREYLYQNNFIEIHTPKIVSNTPTHHTWHSYKLNYFHNQCYLNTTPQFYHQQVIMGDYHKIFEISTHFHQLYAQTHRHLNEFIGLHITLVINEYNDIITFTIQLLLYILNNIQMKCQREMNIVQQQFPIEKPLEYEYQPHQQLSNNEQQQEQQQMINPTIFQLTYQQAHQLLHDDGNIRNEYDDISTSEQYQLSKLMKTKYNIDLYIITTTPSQCCPFYVMKDEVNYLYSNQFTIYLSGNEIASGSQKIHQYELLLHSYQQQQILHNQLQSQLQSNQNATLTTNTQQSTSTTSSSTTIPPSIMSYLQSFQHGILPHGDCTIGLERFTTSLLSIHNIRFASLFPRDPKRCTP